MTRILWIITFSVNLLLTRGEQCGGAVKEGDEFTLNCTLASLDEDLLWQLQEGTGYVNISSCDSGSCTDLLPASFRASRRAVPIPTGEIYVGQLKIISAKRTQKEFKCIRPRDVQELCNLHVYGFPTVALARNCPNGSFVRGGYILTRTEVTYKCEIGSAGSTQVFAQWYNERGDKLGTNEDDGSALLTLYYDNTGTRFTCKLLSALGQPTPEQVIFIPRYAVGPTHINLHLSYPIPLCPSERHAYYFHCVVPSSRVIPQPLFTMMIDNQIVFTNHRGQLNKDNGEIFLTHSFRPESGGSIRIYCKTINEIFTEQTDQTERMFIIHEPPKLAPVFRTYDDQPEPGSNIAYVTGRSNVQLRCSVDGGYPKVHKVTIRCGDLSNTVQGTLATMIANIPNDTRTISCRCSAEHNTGCYDKYSDIVFRINNPGQTFPPQTSLPNQLGQTAPLQTPLPNQLGQTDPELTNPGGRSVRHESTTDPSLENPEKGESQLKDTNNNNLSLGLGIGLGSIIILLVVLVIVFIILYKKRDMKFRKSSDTQFDQSYIASIASYISPGSAHALPPQIPPRNQLVQTDYDLPGGHFRSHESSTDPSLDSDGYVQPTN